MWQQFLKDNARDDFVFVSVAIDTQGAAAAKPFAEPTRDSFLTLVDSDNVLGRAFGFKAIPNGIFINPDGRIDAVTASGFEAREPETLEQVRRWLTAHDGAFETVQELRLSEEALDLFTRASALLKEGDRKQAVELLHRAVEIDPDNKIIHKQLWVLENPERFYNGDIDMEWQRQQLSAGL